MKADTGFASWEAAVLWLKAQPDRQELVRSAYYDDPLSAAANRYWLSDEWRAVSKWLPAHRGSALDIGAGRGIASYALAKEGFSVTALEPDDSRVVGAAAVRQLASEAGLPIHVVQEFSERLPFDDARFDLVFARAVLHHTKDLSAACREFKRVLKPGGTLLAIREHVISRPADLQTFLDNHPLHKLYGGENAFLLDQYQNAMTSAGLKLKGVLSPLETAINYAPYSLDSLQTELARRLCGPVPQVTPLISRTLGLPGIWRLARVILSRIDNRPGRLYSFVALRP